MGRLRNLSRSKIDSSDIVDHNVGLMQHLTQIGRVVWLALNQARYAIKCVGIAGFIVAFES